MIVLLDTNCLLFHEPLSMEIQKISDALYNNLIDEREKLRLHLHDNSTFEGMKSHLLELQECPSQI